MKLHCTTASPFARKVLVLAHEGGLANQLEPVSTNVGTHVPLDTAAHATLARLNGLMKIPVLETDDAGVLFDSRVICEYLAARCHPNPFFPEAPAARWAALRAQALADGILDAALLWRFEQARDAARRSPEWLHSQHRRIIQGLDQFEQGRMPPADAHLTIGSISLGCTLGYLDFRFPDLDWRAECAALTHWYAGFSQRESMRLSAPRVAPSH